MLGPIGSTVMKMLRVLTPDSIERLTKLADGRKRKVASSALSVDVESATSTGVSAPQRQERENEEKEEKSSEQNPSSPKIIPLHLVEDEQVQKMAVGSSYIPSYSGQRSGPVTALESIGVLSNEELKKIKSQEDQKIKDKQPSATIFLLEERKRLHNANAKIYCQTAIRNYRNSTSTVDMAMEEKMDEEPRSNTTSGILLNKKQF